MGFESEDQLYDDDYYCEECKPELHTDLLKSVSMLSSHTQLTGCFPGNGPKGPLGNHPPTLTTTLPPRVYLDPILPPLF